MAHSFIYSFTYTKSQDAVFLSHLDTMRVLERAIRRSGINICYTEGCNPHIRLSVYTALPLGLETDGEWASIRLAESADPLELRRSLAAQMPSGFDIQEVIEGKPTLDMDAPFCIEIGYKGAQSAAERWVAGLSERSRWEIGGSRKQRPYACDLIPRLGSCRVNEESVCIELRFKGHERPRLGDIADALRSSLSEAGLTINGIGIRRRRSLEGEEEGLMDSNP